MYKDILESILYKVENYNKEGLTIKPELIYEVLDERDLMVLEIVQKPSFKENAVKKMEGFDFMIGHVKKAIFGADLEKGQSYIYGFGVLGYDPLDKKLKSWRTISDYKKPGETWQILFYENEPIKIQKYIVLSYGVSIPKQQDITLINKINDKLSIRLKSEDLSFMEMCFMDYELIILYNEDIYLEDDIDFIRHISNLWKDCVRKHKKEIYKDGGEIV